jgi:Recombinase
VYACTPVSRRHEQRRADKVRRQTQPPLPIDPRWPAELPRPIPTPTTANPPRVVARQAAYVERLAYTRSQASQALGISRSTLRRLMPYIDTIEMPWGGKLIPVDELERLATERRRTAQPRLEPPPRGRKPTVSAEIARRIRHERSLGKSLRQIAMSLNADRIPTAHGGERWWPSTVRSVLRRAA